MKPTHICLFLIFGLFLSGCAREAYYADHEYGIASRDAFDQQIVNKDYKHANKPVEGMDGIYAEHVMGTYLDTFTQGFTKEAIDISEIGVISGN